ncbi:spore germination protein [Mobilisporobacter senegalensis]|uniref:Spore germination protein n=1 Tax=Mobilisporobacter senegalensis TaxID=1329262 RepID=A0A3N1XVX8_9FIRM|nr:LysM peptidoglycan-binding domain-containing protein [Mobilisporobacter senegalensis]ROR30753.1 spore germination protein [Mobilisporobacter senegalensis]
MDIYVVQPGDTIDSIANMYGVSAAKLIQDNELETPYRLVPGQTIVIAYPKQTYIVKEGDSVTSIANAYDITILQLFRNNPSLSGRDYLIPGETLVISYHTIRQMTTNGFAYPFISTGTLRRTLPNLTYLSIFNYQTTQEGNIITYSDDLEIIELAKEYQTVPLMMLTTLTTQGEPNVDVAYTLLLNDEYQNKNADNILNILKSKGYYGVNIAFNYLNVTNQNLYVNYISKISNRLTSEGYLVFITINPNFKKENSEELFEKIDYSAISQYVNGMMFLEFIWGKNVSPPSPVCSYTNLKTLTEYVITLVPPEKLLIGKPIISFDWALPFIAGRSRAISLTLNATINLAQEVNAVIQFDEPSQTPYFYYYDFNFGLPVEHIVWSIDSRSIHALEGLVLNYDLNGVGIWNIMIYYPQLWLIINSQYDIIKIIE